MATNMASTSSDSSGRDEISRKELSEFSKHHEKTGCNAVIRLYEDTERRKKGMFCASCKEEWLREIPNVNVAPVSTFKPVVHHYVPKFYYLQVSDTGHYVRWRDIGKLKKGDHVAWNRLLPYWHHGIVARDVQESDEEVIVIEFDGKEITETEKSERDVTMCNCSFMYKVVYPKEVEDQNPPDLVMLRANAMKDRQYGYNLLFHNCEHFATFCKTGSYKCNQIIQQKANIAVLVLKLFLAFLHILVVVFFSETVEFFVPTVTGDWLAAVVLIVLEVLYSVVVFFIIYKIDTPKERYKRNDQSRCTSACKRAATKSVARSCTVVFFICLFGILLVRLIGHWEIKNIEQWSVIKRAGIEVSLGFLGGIVGYLIGSIVFYLIPCCCCYTIITPAEPDAGQGERNTEGAEKQSLLFEIQPTYSC